MRCAKCNQDNPSDASFCESCGSKLELTCPACKTSLSPRARLGGLFGEKMINVLQVNLELRQRYGAPQASRDAEQAAGSSPKGGDSRVQNTETADVLRVKGHASQACANSLFLESRNPAMIALLDSAKRAARRCVNWIRARAVPIDR
jgi:hypothetical protein